MKSIQKLFNGLNLLFWTGLTNADREVVSNNRYVLRGLQSTGLLLLGLMFTLFGLQYLALSTFTQGDHQFSVIAAALSVMILIILDRTVLDSDSRDEGRIEYLLESQPKSPEIAELKKKRASKMAVRVGLGVTIAYIAAELSMAAFLKPEVQAEKNAMEAMANPVAMEQAQEINNRTREVIAGYDEQIAQLERDVDASLARDREARSGLSRDIHNLQKERESLKTKLALATTCQEAELAGRIVEGCRNTGKRGEGDIYKFWGKQQEIIVGQIKSKTQLIQEKQAEMANSPEQITINQANDRLAALRKEKAERKGAMVSEAGEIKEVLEKANAYRTVSGGLVNDSIAVENVLAKAGDTANRNLILFKIWIMTLELAIFAAKLCGATKEYSLALYKVSMRRRKKNAIEPLEQNLQLAA